MGRELLKVCWILEQVQDGRLDPHGAVAEVAKVYGDEGLLCFAFHVAVAVGSGRHSPRDGARAIDDEQAYWNRQERERTR